MPQEIDPYRVLGIKPNATTAQVKAAHRTLAKRYHPDAQGGDAVTFLLVQEAYKLLSDPLRRREWDTRHTPGPVRAGQPAAPRPRAPDGRWTRADRTQESTRADGWRAGRRSEAGDRQAPPFGRDPASRRYTWSASEVPWWEEGGPRENRRQPGRRRPRETAADGGQPSGASAGGGDPARPAGSSGPPRASGSSKSRAPRPSGDEPPVFGTQDFDVYNRSSGAAWSMAARAYFRRGDQHLPNRGSFRHQGALPLTAARARVAAEEEARRDRAAGHGNAGGGSAAGPAATARPAPAARPRPATRPGPAARPAPVSRPGPSPPPPPPASGRRARAAGVARDIHGITEARQAARQRASAAAWPSVSQRLLLALVAWIPLAIAIGYGGAVATGCDRAAISCPSYLEPLQLALITGALVLLVALPRVAYVAALATVGLIGGSALIVTGVWLLGLQRPLSSSVLAISSALLLVVYLATATWIVAAGPRRRPWSA